MCSPFPHTSVIIIELLIEMIKSGMHMSLCYALQHWVFHPCYAFLNIIGIVAMCVQYSYLMYIMFFVDLFPVACCCDTLAKIRSTKVRRTNCRARRRIEQRAPTKTMNTQQDASKQ